MQRTAPGAGKAEKFFEEEQENVERENSPQMKLGSQSYRTYTDINLRVSQKLLLA
ncbi:MAG: hypothetical protein KME30_23210 [Iphinoe sp. HA4291-MV1]|nr:hypothetical protein [Iphinoe sp. HA4291-MV1]